MGLERMKDDNHLEQSMAFVARQRYKQENGKNKYRNIFV